MLCHDRPDRASLFTCSSPIINFSLNLTVFSSVLNQHPTVNFNWFLSLCQTFQKKSHLGSLFNKNAVMQRSVYGYVTLTSAKPRAESVSRDHHVVLVSLYLSGLPSNLKISVTFLFWFIYMRVVPKVQFTRVITSREKCICT